MLSQRGGDAGCDDKVCLFSFFISIGFIVCTNPFADFIQGEELSAVSVSGEDKVSFGIGLIVIVIGLVIEDNGIGIQAEDLPRVFEKGFTGYNGRADKKSTGIGLYLCKKIMDKMGHKIWIDSEVGKGTRVYLELTRKEWNPE